MCLAALARGGTADDLRAVGDRLLGMEGPLLPVKPCTMTLVSLLTQTLALEEKRTPSWTILFAIVLVNILFTCRVKNSVCVLVNV